MNSYKYFIRFRDNNTRYESYHEDWFESDNQANALEMAKAYAYYEQNHHNKTCTELRLIDKVEV